MQMGPDAFVHCESLRIINIPDRVQYVEENIIQTRCANLMTDDMTNASDSQKITYSGIAIIPSTTFAGIHLSRQTTSNNTNNDITKMKKEL